MNNVFKVTRFAAISELNGHRISSAKSCEELILKYSHTMHKHRKHLGVGLSHFKRQLRKFLRNPLFLVLTLCGNTLLLLCASLFYWIEHGTNPNVHNFGDALWWTFATMTTAAYGDIVPVTGAGRLVAVFLMLTAGVLFSSFIALLSSTFIEVEFAEMEHDVRKLSAKVDELSRANGPENQKEH